MYFLLELHHRELRVQHVGICDQYNTRIAFFLITHRVVLFLQEEHSTYPDMAAYHCIAVTLGKAGHLTQLLHLIQSLRKGPIKKHVRGSPKQLNWNGRLEPDIAIYNAVSEYPFILPVFYS